jgi:hypothetical protein
MAKLATIELTGKSGAQYHFNVYRRTDTFNSIGAVYFMTKRVIGSDGNGTHTFIYVGETGDLSARPLNHHCLDCFDRNGANTLLIHAENERSSRLAVETDLRQAYNPPCNKQ